MAIVSDLQHGKKGRDSLSNSPLLFFLIFHKAIRNGLDKRHRLATVHLNGQQNGSISQIDQIFRPRDIKSVYLDSTSDQKKRENLLQNYMASHWMASQKRLLQVGDDEIGKLPSFCDPDGHVFGCTHYKRNCKLRASCCGKFFTCNFCHDKMSDHPMDRNVYHCPFCNICRVGQGLGVDCFHCMTCNCCLSSRLLSHECKEKCLETGCTLCNEFLFTSTAPIRALPSGHFIHSTCFQACESIPCRCSLCEQSSGDAVAKKLYPFLLWFGLGRVKSVGKEVQNVAEGSKAEDKLLLCGFVMCCSVLFCVMGTLVSCFLPTL